MKARRERRTSQRTRALSEAVRRLPTDTRVAMLAALDTQTLIVGAYTDRSGRVCPQLAAHRQGAQANAVDFARAWDEFGRARRPRLATERELQILRAVLGESLTDASRPTTTPQPTSTSTATESDPVPLEAVKA